ncbi:hypothetical protein BWI15_07760 [Kribbella sp. ALI-6-A]|uniref:Rv1733c family protein n=1 Tax=Kribbella sp. ALI-6-A TaxID=1933817 RepID=UPI00097BF387|nr:hypothetical protein [Kribbella sp. ALI-6-A]ONI75716.1 hypothetical protein BWI15_07760 [Kribbella sp. ALI-6-A]
MTSTQQRRAERAVLMKLRLLGLGRNPLRRRVDRVESGVIIAVLIGALLAIPVAPGLGTSVREQADRTAAERKAQLRQVEARTVENTAEIVPSTPGQVTSQVRVVWFDATGLSGEGRAEVLIGTRAGTALTIWLDRNGSIARAPRESADSVALGVAAGFALLMVAWPLLWGGYRLARLSLDRRRAQEWEREWELVSPRWTRSQN